MPTFSYYVAVSVGHSKVNLMRPLSFVEENLLEHCPEEYPPPLVGFGEKLDFSPLTDMSTQF